MKNDTSNELGMAFDRYINSLKTTVKMAEKELEETKKFGEVLFKLDKVLKDREVENSYSSKKRAVIQQLENMGYYIWDTPDYTRVYLKTKKGATLSFMMYPHDFEIDNIVAMVVNRMNSAIINTL